MSFEETKIANIYAHWTDSFDSYANYQTHERHLAIQELRKHNAELCEKIKELELALVARISTYYTAMMTPYKHTKYKTIEENTFPELAYALLINQNEMLQARIVELYEV